MWNDQKRMRFEELREPGRQLDATEKAELAGLVKDLEDAEAVYLKPCNERMRQENEGSEMNNDQLDKLVQRKEALAQRLTKVLAESQAERRAIESELATVLAGTRSLDTED